MYELIYVLHGSCLGTHTFVTNLFRQNKICKLHKEIRYIMAWDENTNNLSRYMRYICKH